MVRYCVRCSNEKKKTKTKMWISAEKMDEMKTLEIFWNWIGISMLFSIEFPDCEIRFAHIFSICGFQVACSSSATIFLLLQRARKVNDFRYEMNRKSKMPFSICVSNCSGLRLFLASGLLLQLKPLSNTLIYCWLQIIFEFN